MDTRMLVTTHADTDTHTHSCTRTEDQEGSLAEERTRIPPTSDGEELGRVNASKARQPVP